MTEAATAAAVDLPKPADRPYIPRGAAAQLMRLRDPEVLVSGPAGTGKSRANLEKLYACAEKYAGMRGLIIRKTRESLTETALVTWEKKVVPEGHPCLAGPQRKLRSNYVFSNKSEIIVAGLDKASKVMSTEFDMIFVQEATELIEAEHEALTTRLRNGEMPYQQLILDCNPDHPKHWLKLRCDNGKTKMLESRHEDNPVLWDAKENKWTPQGEAYIAKLDALTGPRKKRLRWGIWAQAEGMVYESWDPLKHVIDRFDIPKSWDRHLVFDFGYTNPFVCQWWAEDPDGRLYRYREIYLTHRLVEDHARNIKQLHGEEPTPRTIVCDHDAEGRATLERHLGWTTLPAMKAKAAGIQEVESRLKSAGDGKPRIFFLRDSLVERDPGLVEARKPCCTEEEITGYIWDTRNGRRKGEEPIDRDNHGMDATRYIAATIAERPVWSPSGISSGGSSVYDDAPAGVFGMV
jgi:hypothetical protein